MVLQNIEYQNNNWSTNINIENTKNSIWKKNSFELFSKNVLIFFIKIII